MLLLYSNENGNSAVRNCVGLVNFVMQSLQGHCGSLWQAVKGRQGHFGRDRTRKLFDWQQFDCSFNNLQLDMATLHMLVSTVRSQTYQIGQTVRQLIRH